jgi:hypothetical protein
MLASGRTMNTVGAAVSSASAYTYIRLSTYIMLYIYIYIYIYIYVALGGLVVSVLATGPKVRGFDPDRGRWIFKGFFRRGSKAVVDLRHITSGLSQWAGHSLQQRS